MAREGMIEGLPINILGMFGQMRPDGSRQISVGPIGHRFPPRRQSSGSRLSSSKRLQADCAKFDRATRNEQMTGCRKKSGLCRQAQSGFAALFE
jgi:hypothetical protein